MRYFSRYRRPGSGGLRFHAGPVVAGALTLSLAAVTACSTSGSSSSASSTGNSPGSSSSASAQAMSTITIGLPGGSSQAHFWDYMVATDLGFFTKNHLKVNVVDTQNATTTAQAVTAGRVDIGETAPDSFILAMNKGANIVLIGQGSGSPEAVVAGKDITSYSQLKGQKIATISTTSGTGLVLLKVLQDHGYANPLTSFNFVISGSTPARLAALQSGAVAATLLSPPALFTAVDAGDHILSYATTDVPVPEVYFAVYKPYATSNPQQVVDFLTAMQQAAIWLDNPGNENQAIQILMKYAAGTSLKIAQQTYGEAITQLHSFGPGIMPVTAGLKADLNLLGENPSTYAKYLDTSYAAKAVAAAGSTESK